MAGGMRRSGACMRCVCLVVLAVASALCVSGPALYWRYKKSFNSSSSSASSLSWISFLGGESGSVPLSGLHWRSGSSCPSCTCNCPPPLPSICNSRACESLNNRKFLNTDTCLSDCGKNDPELRKEMEKQFVDLLTEELKLQEVVSEEHNRHSNATLTDARRLALQYQRESEKCNAATEACEEAREWSEAALAKERKITALWERRARQLGWQDS